MPLRRLDGDQSVGHWTASEPRIQDQVDTVHEFPVKFPDAYIARRESAVTGKSRLSFTVKLADGTPRHGIYGDRDNLALSDGDATVWADTIAWFLSLLPPGTATVVMRGEGPTTAELPAQIRTPGRHRRLLLLPAHLTTIGSMTAGRPLADDRPLR